MPLHATQLAKDADAGEPASSTVSAPAGRFAYASGSKPLAGYTLKRGIGHGGFGEVYYATSDAGKEVALKLIRRNWDVELRGVNHCLNLKHPNLLALYDVRQDANDDNWVVMELMSGESLEDVLQRLPNGLPVEEALAWMHGIAAGVAYLHDHGIVHRDLKPANIFVDEGIVKIGDYGLSKFMSCSRRSGQTGSVGTVHYMAPEVANGRYGKEIDIYALGIILYEMLTGHVPFEGESVGEILMKHLTAEPDVSKLAEPYRTIVARTLAKDPAKRFASVEEMIAMLPPAPASAALTAAARYAGPNAAVAQRTTSQAIAAEANGTPGNVPLAIPVDNLIPENSPPTRQLPHAAALPPYQGEPPIQPAPISKLASDEPIQRWLHQSWSDLAAWWEEMNFQPWQKLLILLGVGFAAFKMIPLWLPALMVTAICYVIYRVVRSFVMVQADNLNPPSHFAPGASHSPDNASLAMPKHFAAMRWAWLLVTVSPAVLLGLLNCLQSMMHIEGRRADLLEAAIVTILPLGSMGYFSLKSRRFSLATIIALFSIGFTGSLGLFATVDLPELLKDPDAWMLMFWPAAVFALSSYLGLLGLRWLGFDVFCWLEAYGATADGRSSSQRNLDAKTSGEQAPNHRFDVSLTRQRWRQHSTMAHYEPGTLRDRSANLLESMLTSAAVVAVMSLVMGILRGSEFEPSQYTWLATTALLGSWAVLVPAKLWERKKIDPAVRRFVFLVIGLAIGAVSYGVMQWLLVTLPSDRKLIISDDIQGLQTEFFRPDGSPKMSALLAFYGFVFVVLRWWKLADPLRHTRLSLWAVAVAVFWSFAINLFWPFPQPWGMMTVATIAVAVQMASPCAAKTRSPYHAHD